MFAGLRFAVITLANLFKSRRRLEAENMLLRRQLGVALRRVRPRPRLRGMDRAIGSLRRECLDQMLIFGEEHLRRVLATYADYYNQTRPHLSLQKDAPLGRAVQRIGAVIAIPVLGGLHHEYVRI
jgi:Integrase core domain